MKNGVRYVYCVQHIIFGRMRNRYIVEIVQTHSVCYNFTCRCYFHAKLSTSHFASIFSCAYNAIKNHPITKGASILCVWALCMCPFEKAAHPTQFSQLLFDSKTCPNHFDFSSYSQNVVGWQRNTTLADISLAIPFAIIVKFHLDIPDGIYIFK